MKTSVLPSWRAEEICRQHERSRRAPKLMLSLSRYDEAARLFFLGLREHYLDAIASGRLEAWKAAAHASIELMASVPGTEIVSRARLHAATDEEGK